MKQYNIRVIRLLGQQLNKKICENIYFCDVMMPSKDTKILKFTQVYSNLFKSIKAPTIMLVDLECLIKKMDVKIIQ